MKKEIINELKSIGIVAVLFIIGYLVVSDLATEHITIVYDRIESISNYDDCIHIGLVNNLGVTLCGDDAEIWCNYNIDSIDIVKVIYSDSKIGSKKLIFIEVVSWKAVT